MHWKLSASVLLGLAGLFFLTTAWAGPRLGGDEEEKKAVKKPAEKPPEKAAEKPPADKPAETPTKPAKEDEEEVRPKKGLTGPVNLSEEAKRAPHPRIKEVFDKFAVQCDVITLAAGGNVEIAPLRKRFDPADPKTITYKALKDGTERTLSRDSVQNINHYEMRVMAAAKELQQSGLDKPSGNNPAAVTRSKLLKAVEMLLIAGQQFHKDGKEKNVRGDGWLGLDDVFKREIQQVHVAQLQALTGEADWDGGEAFAKQLRDVYSPTGDLMGAIESHYVAMAETLMDKNSHALARERLDFWQKKYHTGDPPPAVVQVHKRLQDKARTLLNESIALGAKKDDSGALNALQRAEAIWPQLPGIPEQRAKYLQARPVLRVGVRQLPTQISPTTALTDVDRAACQLVYDTLFHLRSAPSARDGYECKLGLEIRQTSQGGWELTLPSDLKWSDGKPFTTEDVRRSFEVYTDRRVPYYNPLADPIKNRFIGLQTLDDYHLTITFERGHLDPLSFLTFPLLPASRLPRERNPCDSAFGKTPIGTGPYMFKGIEGNEAVFEANPHYRRPHAPNGPALREIRFVQYSDFAQAKQAIANGSWQLLFDVSSKERDELEGVANVQVATPTRQREGGQGLTNPRIWFLLPNHRSSLGNVDIRKAISMLLQRDKIIESVFRGKEAKDHEVLNGPFPVHSWAYDPGLLPSVSPPYKPQVGQGHRQKVPNMKALSLKFPNDDPQAAAACKMIQEQLAALQNPIAITLEPTSRTDLMLHLTKDRPEFELIYTHYDFPNETLDLWPLFDNQGMPPAGRNYMGFTSDAEVQGEFRRLQGRREWNVVKNTTHALHGRITETAAVFIPLWQLDHHVAVHKSLRTKRLHPLWVFDDVEEWRLEFRD